MSKLIEELSQQREKAINNGDKIVSLEVDIKDLTEVITGLKMAKAFDNILDEEIAIKHSRRQ